MAFVFKSNNKKHNVVFICSSNFHAIKNSSAKELMMNLSEYQITSITSEGFDVQVAISETATLTQVVNDYDYAVVYTPDTEFEGNKFFNNLHELLKKDFFLAGHILDRKEAYYELHEQCYVVNLRKYKEYECPDIGEFGRNQKHFENAPIRSDENFHDDYTPLWVKPGDEFTEFKHKCHGWNILRVAFDNKENVEVFNQNMRNSKRCYYATHETDFIENSQWIYKKYNLCNSRLFYPVNTEEPQEVNVKGPLKQLIVPASGFNWIKYLEKYGYDENTEVLFYDYNPNALYYMQKTVEKFSGGDYQQFLKKHNRNKTPDWLSTKLEIADHFSTVSNTWKHITSIVKFKFVECDLLNEFNLKILNDENTIFNISNVFAYGPTAFMIGTKERLYKENKLLRILKEKFPKINLIASYHAWDGFVEYPIHADNVTKFDEVDIETLKTPLWRFGNDWKKPKDSMEEYDKE